MKYAIGIWLRIRFTIGACLYVKVGAIIKGMSERGDPCVRSILWVLAQETPS